METHANASVSLRWHFQALFGVIISGSIQTESNRIEKPSIKKLPAWLLSKLHVIDNSSADWR